MKTLGLVLLFAAAACAVDGCSDSASEGWDANGVVDVSDDTLTVYGDVEPDESPPPDVSADTADKDVLTAEEACAPYLGTWDCECTEGSCDIGSHAFILVELLQANSDGTWTYFVTVLNSNGVESIMTCDPLHMPPTDSISTVFQITSQGQAKMTFQNPANPDDWLILQCTQE